MNKISNLVNENVTVYEASAHEDSVQVKDKFKFRFVSAGSIAKIIKGLKNTSALDIDRIPTLAWKLGVETLAGPVAKVPELFKNALIHPVYKGGGKNPRLPGSYRPIAILPALSKILETVVRDTLLQWLEEHEILPESQFGFRPKRSAATALACSQADWISAKIHGEAVAIVPLTLLLWVLWYKNWNQQALLELH